MCSRKGKTVHIPIDNSDGRQQTLIVTHTTHYANGTVFQLNFGSEETEREKKNNMKEECVMRI